MTKVVKRINGLKMIQMIMAILIVGSLMGCSSDKEIPVSQINEAIQKDATPSNVEKAGPDELESLYDIKKDDVKDFVLYTATSNVKADELLIIEAKDEKDIEALKGKIENRIDQQSERFGSYLPDEDYLIKHNILETKGNTILFVISKDAQKIEEVFEKSFE